MRRDDLRAAARRLAHASCAEQGLGVGITTAAVVSNVATLLATDKRIDAPDLDAPNGFHAPRVELVETSPAGADDHVIENGGDDRLLAT